MDKTTWAEFVTSVVKKMRADSRSENKRLTPGQIKMILRNNLKLSYAGYSAEEINTLIEYTYPFAMRAYKGPQAMGRPAKSAEEFMVEQGRASARRAAVRANRRHRR